MVDDTRETDDVLTLTLWAPNPDDDDDFGGAQEDERAADEQLVLRAVADLTAKGNVANVRALRGAVAISHRRADDAIERLLASDELVETAGPNRSRVFTMGGE